MITIKKLKENLKKELEEKTSEFQDNHAEGLGCTRILGYLDCLEKIIKDLDKTIKNLN